MLQAMDQFGHGVIAFFRRIRRGYGVAYGLWRLRHFGAGRAAITAAAGDQQQDKGQASHRKVPQAVCAGGEDSIAAPPAMPAPGVAGWA
ncbi:hypothetical protein GCM10007235_30440 [Pseudoxanthomonas indica]|nr:hypothetical protein GCM10007235_30440 [Pseudoxanthomonas indica]